MELDGFIIACTSRNVSFSVSAGKRWSLGKRYGPQLHRLAEYYTAMEIGLVITRRSECERRVD